MKEKKEDAWALVRQSLGRPSNRYLMFFLDHQLTKDLFMSELEA